jgi:hypothetical protein
LKLGKSIIYNLKFSLIEIHIHDQNHKTTHDMQTFNPRYKNK